MKSQKILSALGLCMATIPGIADTQMETMVITGTGSERNKYDLAEAVTQFDAKAIQDIAPSHPSDLLNRAAGVYVNNLGGEGHMTAIRQPLTTKGVYLFLEDGIPTRPTGFFNHNGLYEVNIPQSGAVEVIKGPATALYGSEAIGGVINTITQAPTEDNTSEVNLEGGSFGYKRALLSNSATYGAHGYRINLNLGSSDGYRDNSAFNRESFTTRWDFTASDKLTVKSFLSYTHVNQSGSSSLNAYDFKHDPKKNLYRGDVGAREINALRLSSEFSYQLAADKKLQLTPFVRVNQSTMMPSWMVTYDPNTRDTAFQTYGFLAKYYQTLSSLDGELVMGMDIDYTPSRYKEHQVTMMTEDSKGDTYYTNYIKTGRLNYDFTAAQQSISPFIQLDLLLLEPLRLSMGLRYDNFAVDYKDKLSANVPEEIQGNRGIKRWYRPDSQVVRYDSWSPKLGLIYSFSDRHNSYLSYRHAFRAPTIGELFRSGPSVNSVELKPVKADSLEWGLRGIVNAALTYDMALYYMIKNDDIVSIVHDNNRQTVNAGKTAHAGIELTLQGAFSDEWSYNAALNYTKQTYREFEYYVYPENVNFDGNTIALAPKTLGNLSLAYVPTHLDGFRVEVEWEHVGEYYTDDSNTDTYDGYNIANIRANYRINRYLELYARIHNLTNVDYSTYSSRRVTDDETDYKPGLPRSYYAGIRATF